MTASIRGGIFTMAMLLKGAEVAKALTEGLHAKTEELKKNGVEPCLAILRVGAREDDLAYERGALKRCEKVGVAVRQVVLPEDVTQEVLMENIHALNADEKVHGVLMFRPLPGHLDDEAARAALDPKKDMDGITDGSMTAVYAGTKGGYPPCTAAACVALLKHYNIPIKGKRVVVIGRSLVIGKPVSLLLLAEHATVTICHSRSENLPDICQDYAHEFSPKSGNLLLTGGTGLGKTFLSARPISSSSPPVRPVWSARRACAPVRSCWMSASTSARTATSAATPALPKSSRSSRPSPRSPAASAP